jgi:hypothetical protein
MDTQPMAAVIGASQGERGVRTNSLLLTDEFADPYRPSNALSAQTPATSRDHARRQ